MSPLNLWNPYVLVILSVVLVSVGGISYVLGSSGQKVTCAENKATAVVKGVQKYEKKSVEVGRLSDDALRVRYCKWVRDRPDLCLKGDSPFLP